jgi:hypothetical protein
VSTKEVSPYRERESGGDKGGKDLEDTVDKGDGEGFNLTHRGGSTLAGDEGKGV